MISKWQRIVVMLALFGGIAGCAGAHAGDGATTRYVGGGVSFRHPDTTRVELSGEGFDRPTVVVHSDRARALIRIESTLVDSAKLRAQTVDRVLGGLFRDMRIDAQRTGTATSRRIAGHRVDGVLVVGADGPTTIVAEVYAVRVPGKSAAVVLLYPESEAARDAVPLDVVARTLERDARAARRSDNPLLRKRYGFVY